MSRRHAAAASVTATAVLLVLGLATLSLPVAVEAFNGTSSKLTNIGRLRRSVGQIPAKQQHKSNHNVRRSTSASSITITDSDYADDNINYALAIPRWERFSRQVRTLLRVGVPSIIAGVVSTLAFPALARWAATVTNSARSFTVLSPAATDYTGQFLSVIGLLYSLLVGQTYSFVYSQQEAVFYALYNEVTEAKSLLEQVALVCQGRAMYPQVLRSIKAYVRNDLRQVQADPALLLSRRPADDPLESIMYLTSVGVPGHVYETIRSLRHARAARLGALQRKVPSVHMGLLWILAGIMLITFPLLGASTVVDGAYNIITVEGYLFGMTSFAITLTKMLMRELLRPAGGAYNVDAVLGVMVKGLERELDERLRGGHKNNNAPSTPTDMPMDIVTQ
mmetsp:Transcript_21395/g.43993  ORF Transcript_21395/g.43993 Transcript_21395/m.43993 type:complete len:393 (-) Transcript_21395:1568-2746(-)